MVSCNSGAIGSRSSGGQEDERVTIGAAAGGSRTPAPRVRRQNRGGGLQVLGSAVPVSPKEN